MDKFINSIICADCIEVLDGQKPFADLIFADPPFNIGYKYDKYYDKVKSKNYIAWTKQWMKVCFDVLRQHGSFYIAIGDDYAANVKVIADELGLVMRNWIIWHYTFGQQMKNKFARAHTHIFYFVKDAKNFTFNDDSVRVPSDRQLIYNDKRANPRGKLPDDVWDNFSRVCGTFKERTGWHPCQMPEGILKRIIAASSNRGDCVLDPFSGSATTLAASRLLGRKYIGIEISENYVRLSEKRLAELKQPDNQFRSEAELSEIKRLADDIKIPIKEIINDNKLTRLFADQLSIRTDRKYEPQQILAAIRELKD